MNSEQDNSVLLFFGGAIAIFAIGAAALKAVEACLKQMGATFVAFGNMVAAFFPMLFKILAMVSLVCAIILCVVAGIYFSMKYIKMVKRATELKEHVDSELNIRFLEFRKAIEKEVITEVKDLRSRTYGMESKLYELLKPATPVAPEIKVVAVEKEPHQLANVDETSSDPEDIDDEEAFYERQPY